MGEIDSIEEFIRSNGNTYTFKEKLTCINNYLMMPVNGLINMKNKISDAPIIRNEIIKKQVKKTKKNGFDASFEEVDETYDYLRYLSKDSDTLRSTFEMIIDDSLLNGYSAMIASKYVGSNSEPVRVIAQEIVSRYNRDRIKLV